LWRGQPFGFAASLLEHAGFVLPCRAQAQPVVVYSLLYNEELIGRGFGPRPLAELKKSCQWRDHARFVAETEATLSAENFR
jgi:hypothetical protein